MSLWGAKWQGCGGGGLWGCDHAHPFEQVTHLWTASLTSSGLTVLVSLRRTSTAVQMAKRVQERGLGSSARFLPAASGMGLLLWKSAHLPAPSLLCCCFC